MSASEERKLREKMTEPTRDDQSRLDRERHEKVCRYLQMDYQDALYIDPSIIPDDVDYLWARESIHGELDSSRIPDLMRKGWTAVPSSRHPELCMEDVPGREMHRKGSIYNKGLVLYERAKFYGKMEKENMAKHNLHQMTSIKADASFMNDSTPPIKVIFNETSFSKNA